MKEEKGKIQMVNDKEEIVWVEIWEPTMNLRWKETSEYNAFTERFERILEQKWQCSNGEVEWREIPTV